jgi:acetyl esterase/lipase
MKSLIPALLMLAIPTAAWTQSPGARPTPLPVSAFASEEARAAFEALSSAPPEPDFKGDVAAMRRWQGDREEKRLAEARKRYAVDIHSETIAGVPVDVVTPKEGIAPANAKRVLLSLHGGAFMWGAGAGALSEAVPIAATGRVKVIAVNYRMAPEFRFPAASEDVAAVYRSLLRDHNPLDIGLYGCSAGGILAAQSVAWFATHGLPQPGAIATLCGTGAEVDGDSGYFAAWSAGTPLPPGATPLRLANLPYFQGASPTDALAFPIQSDKVLGAFPPTLLLAGNRDFAASSLTVMHRRLRRAGVPADLYIFDGLWHAFVMDSSLPESREAYDVVWNFFDSHLGGKAR